MPKDAEAVAAIGESFTTLLAFCKQHAAIGKKPFEIKVNAKLQSSGLTVFGYKKALQCLIDEWTQRCGVFLYDGDEVDATENPTGDATEEWRKKYYKQVCDARQ